MRSAMKPFNYFSTLDSLTDHYPSADALLAAAENGNSDIRDAICRLWLSEGIPSAFKDCPGVYEAIRLWLAYRLDIQAKEVTIIGSGRHGFSLSPDLHIRRQFGGHSDLDFTIISTKLFQRLSSTLERWMHDYESGLIQPRSETEKGYWNANLASCSSGLKRGFVDSHKIPAFEPYPEAKEIAQVKYLLYAKLKETLEAPRVKGVSFRIYSNWDSFINQMSYNLMAAIKYTKNNGHKHYAD